MLELERSDHIAPKCPHCSDELAKLLFRGLRTTLGKRYVYFCPGCRSVLGVSHRKGFFMG